MTTNHKIDELHNEESERWNDIFERELGKINKKGFIRCFDIHTIGSDYHLNVGCELFMTEAQKNKVIRVIKNMARLIGSLYDIAVNKATDGIAFVACVELTKQKK